MASRSNMWLRQSQAPRATYTPTDPVSQQLERAVRDVRNAQTLEAMVGGKDDATTQAILTPILETVAQKVRETLAAGQTPKQDDTNQMLHDYLKQRLTMKQLDALEGNPAASLPIDMMKFAEGAVNIQKAAAETAMSVADKERQLRLEAEQNVDGAAAYAREQEQQKAQQTIDIIKEMQATVLSMMEKSHAKDLEFKDYQMTATVESLKKTAEDAIASLKSTFENALSLKDQIFEHKTKLLEKDHALDLLNHKLAAQAPADPDYTWKMDQIQRDRLTWEREHKHQEAKDEEMIKTLGSLRTDIIPQAMDIMKTVLGGGLSIDNPFGPGNAGNPPDNPGLAGTV